MHLIDENFFLRRVCPIALPNLLISLGDKSFSPAARPTPRFRAESQPHRQQNDCAGGLGRRESSCLGHIQKILALLSIGLRTGLHLCLRAALTCSAERLPIGRVPHQLCHRRF
jgi:hypothetical protein